MSTFGLDGDRMEFAVTVVKECIAAAGDPCPACPDEVAAWRDVSWRAVAIVRSTLDEPWPCWGCWSAAGPLGIDAAGELARCPHGTWNLAPPPVIVTR